MLAYNLLRTKHFHGVSSGNPHPYWLKPRYGKVRIMQVLHCPYCQGTNIIRQGKTRQGKQRYCCQETVCDGRTFLWDYSYSGHSAEIKQQIVDMAMNAGGIRDTARVLHVSPTTVIKELKKRAGVAASESSRAGVLASRARR